MVLEASTSPTGGADQKTAAANPTTSATGSTAQPATAHSSNATQNASTDERQQQQLQQPQRRLKKLAPFSVKALNDTEPPLPMELDAQDLPTVAQNSLHEAKAAAPEVASAQAIIASTPSTDPPSSLTASNAPQAQVPDGAMAGANPMAGPARRREKKDDSVVDLLLLFLFLIMIFGSIFLFAFSDLFIAHGTRGSGGRKMADTTFRLMVSLESVATGATVESDFPGGGRQVVCNQCQGSGADGGKGGGHLHTCNACDGKGFIAYRRQIAPGFYQDVRQNCHVCNGRGSVVHKPCPHCDGIGLQRDNHTPLRIPLPVGVPDGFRVVLREAGDQPTVQDHARGVKFGDVVVTIQTRPDNRFTRRGQDLVYSLPLSLRQALLGFETTILLLDGSSFHLDRQHVVTQPGDVIRIQGKGLPAFDADAAISRNKALPPNSGFFNAAKGAISDVIDGVQKHLVQPVQNVFDTVIGLRRRPPHTAVDDEEREAVSLPAGDLIIEFQVNFPARSHAFTKEQQEELRRILPQPPVTTATPRKNNQNPTTKRT